MRILWVKVGGLWPLTTGGRLRSFHLISELARRHRVTVLTTHGPGDDARGLMAQLKDCLHVASVPHHLPRHDTPRFALSLLQSWPTALPVDVWKCQVSGLQREVQRHLAAGDVDVCVADFLAAAPNVPLGGSGVPVVLFAHNVEHQIWKRMRDHARDPLRRALLEIEWRKMRRYESHVCRQAALTLAVSDQDRQVLAGNAPGASIVPIPTGVDTTYFSAAPEREIDGRLVFTGAMDWYPNDDGIRQFLATGFPLIKTSVPHASLTIVGRNPSPALIEAARLAGVTVTGTVADVRPHVLEGAVSIVPLRIGGGTRLKIFEALAMGKAVVSTAIGAEGLPLTPGEHYECADDPQAFARAVATLLTNKQRREALGRAGRALVEQRYSWPQVAQTFERHLADVGSVVRGAGL